MKYNGNVKDLYGCMGIYQITCIPNGRIYIGSTRCLGRRRTHHKSCLNMRKHVNPHFQRAWNKYGEEAFVYEILEICQEQVLQTREQQYLDTLKPFGERGFNLCPTAYSQGGIKRTKEAISQRLETIYANAPDLTVISPQDQSFTFKNIAAFAREHNLSHAGLHNVLTGRCEYTKDGWRLPGKELSVGKIIDPNGIVLSFGYGKLRAFCREKGLHYGYMRQVMRGKKKSYKGWTVHVETVIT